MTQLLIAPSILAADFMNLEDELKKIEACGADLVHVDVMDGHFVPNLTIGPDVIAQMKKTTKLPLDVHLMIESPDQWVERYAAAGADWLTIHIEATPHAHRVLEKMKSLGVKSGVSLNPATPALQIEPLLALCDHVLVMSVNPGFGGQSFIESSTEKIAKLKEMIGKAKLKTIIEVDGGITSKTAPAVCKAGARVLVAGTEIFKSKDYAKSIRTLREALA